MTNRDLALAFVRYFAAGDLGGLRTLLAPDLRFRGPLLRTNTADAYLDALASGPLQPAEARILHVGAGAEAVSVFYDYIRPAGLLTVAQLFRFQDGLIAETVVVFDAREV